VPQRQVHGGPAGLVVPVVFKIPGDLKDTHSDDPKNRMVWMVQAKARMPGVDYQDEFEVPVFHTTESLTEDAAQDSAVFLPSINASVAGQLLESGIIVKMAESGGTEFDFSAARNPWLAIRASLFFLVFTGFIGFLQSMGTSFGFLAVFMVLDLVLLISALFQWLGTSKALIGSGRVQTRKGLLGLGPTRAIPCSDIDSIMMPIGSYEESSAGTAYYDIKLQLNNGEQVVLANAIRNKREAEWLITKMKELLGLK
jgi:hypothetical protein